MNNEAERSDLYVKFHKHKYEQLSKFHQRSWQKRNSSFRFWFFFAQHYITLMKMIKQRIPMM